MKAPTYTAPEIERMASTITDADGMKLLATLINEEIELYNDDDLMIITRASIIILVRSLLIGSIKLLL